MQEGIFLLHFLPNFCGMYAQSEYPVLNISFIITLPGGKVLKRREMTGFPIFRQGKWRDLPVEKSVDCVNNFLHTQENSLLGERYAKKKYGKNQTFSKKKNGIRKK